MAKKTGLGKGLNALFSENNIKIEKEEEIKEGEKVVNLKITTVEPNRDQPRKVFNEEALEELAESIKRYGLIQPIIVTKQDDYYQIIAGERRWRASKKAGLDTIPAIIRENNEQKNKEIALIENIQREDLNAFEKASGIKLLMDEYSLTQQQVADIIGKSRSGVANTLKEGKLTEAHCRALLAYDDAETQYKAAVKIIENGSSVREVEHRTKRATSKKVDKRYEPIYRDIEDSFQEFFGTKVKLNAGARKGKIVIEYNSNDDLTRILDLIK